MRNPASLRLRMTKKNPAAWISQSTGRWKGTFGRWGQPPQPQPQEDYGLAVGRFGRSPLRFLSSSSSSSSSLSDGFTSSFADDTAENKGERDDWQGQEQQRLQSLFPQYTLDDWQCQAGLALREGHHVVVCAPTGSGKTVVGEMALAQALERHEKAIYTTPLKALSNQKFVELFRAYPKVGLATGEVSIQRRAPVVVMTTEVYRNMAWRAKSNTSSSGGGAVAATAAAASGNPDATGGMSEARRVQDALEQLKQAQGANDTLSASNDDDNGDDDEYLQQMGVLVLDEFHYMGVPGRGGVWEESVIFSPPHVQIVALSATLPNAADLAAWIQEVSQRPTTLIQASGPRPVPLRFLYLHRAGLFPLFRNPNAGPGAPDGLLGWQEEEAQEEKEGRGGEGFARRAEKEDRPKKPPGLAVHPQLQLESKKAKERVEKTLQRRLMQRQGEYEMDVASEDDFRFSKKQRRRDDNDDDNNQGRQGRRRRPSFRWSSRQESRERDRLLKVEMRKSVPSLGFVVQQLNSQGLLPAIFFLFSRAGCEDAAEQVALSMKRRGQRSREARATSNRWCMEELEEGRSSSEEESESSRSSDSDSDDDDYSDNDTDSDDSSEEEDPLSQGTKRGPRRPSEKRNSQEEEEEEEEALYGAEPIYRDMNGRAFRSDTTNGQLLSDDGLMSSLSDDDDDDNNNNDDDDDDDADDDDDNEESHMMLQRYAQDGLLDLRQVREVAARIASFNAANPEIAVTLSTREGFLFGVASHHAGMLAAHKALVESLFQSQLVKVVFATETLAAGINMPARTTVIGSLSKRSGTVGGSSIKLLETSNLLQMAGRAGRRGMDTNGCCVIVATPFEGPHEAADILTNAVKPIESQFRPSYSLAMNLIRRGLGGLDAARELVEKSFAMWEKRKRWATEEEAAEKKKPAVAPSLSSLETAEWLERIRHESLFESLQVALVAHRENVARVLTPNRIDLLLELLEEGRRLRKGARSYAKLVKRLQLEQEVLATLEKDAAAAAAANKDDDLRLDIFSASSSSSLEAQRKVVAARERDVKQHLLSYLAIATNVLLEECEGALAQKLQRDVEESRQGKSTGGAAMGADELCAYVESMAVMFKIRKQAQKRGQEILSDGSIVMVSMEDATKEKKKKEENDPLEEFLALIRVLEAYGCVTVDHDNDSEEIRYRICPAGDCIGQLGLDNALWCLVALGAAWDVKGASLASDSLTGLDLFPTNDDSHDNDDDDEALPQREAQELVSCLRKLTPAEMAGFVSCLVSEGPRGGGDGGVEGLFHGLSPGQQEAIRRAVQGMERLVRVQRQECAATIAFGPTTACVLELSAAHVVSAWANGCSWNEALELSGVAPGDLARTLSRAMDALRQVGKLPAHFQDHQSVKNGVDGLIRRKCRQAARLMNRYPVKDALPFDLEKDEDEDDLDDDDDEEEEEEEAREDL